MSTDTSPQARTFCNLNGNSKDDLLNQYTEVSSQIERLKTSFLKTDFYHGRNSINRDHADKLRERREEALNLLHDFQMELSDVMYDVIWK